MIDWRPMTEWPPAEAKLRARFLFWYPAANGAVTPSGVLLAQAYPEIAERPSGGRTPVAFAVINPPDLFADPASAARLAAVLGLVGPDPDLDRDFWGPGREDARATVLSALAGKKVPKARAGFNAFREALYAALGVGPGSAAFRRSEFRRLALAARPEVPLVP